MKLSIFTLFKFFQLYFTMDGTSSDKSRNKTALTGHAGHARTAPSCKISDFSVLLDP